MGNDFKYSGIEALLALESPQCNLRRGIWSCAGNLLESFAEILFEQWPEGQLGLALQGTPRKMYIMITNL